jgi:hypothetical protein
MGWISRMPFMEEDSTFYYTYPDVTYSKLWIAQRGQLSTCMNKDYCHPKSNCDFIVRHACEILVLCPHTVLSVEK